MEELSLKSSVFFLKLRPNTQITLFLRFLCILLNYVTLKAYNHIEELMFPVLIELDNLPPVLGDLPEPLTLGQIDKCQ